MGWFDEQIKQKIKNDEDSFTGSLMEMSGIVMGKDNIAAAMNDDRTVTIEAISNILKFYHVKPQEIPDRLKDMNDILEFLLRPSGFMRRRVTLKGKWYESGIGALLGTYKESGKAVALIPSGSYGYEYVDEQTGKMVKINAKTALNISSDALCFYKPLPLKAINIKELSKYIIQTMSKSDYIMIFVSALLITLLGMLTPYGNNLIFQNSISSGNMNILSASAILLAGVAITTACVKIVRQLIMAKIKTKMSISIESASVMRLLSLPAGFFKNYSAGDLASRVQDINGVCSMIVEIALTVGLSTILSLIYLVQVYSYAPALMPVVIIILVVYIAVSIMYTILHINIMQNKMELSAKESGLVFSLFSGIQKIKLSGAEKRAFAKWADQYSQDAKLEYDPPLIIKISPVVKLGISLAGTIAIYYSSIRASISPADYISFNIAYAMLIGAFSPIADMSETFARIKSIFTLIRPILEEVPEVSEDKKVVTRLSGGIELNNVSFRYSEDMPLIIDNLSLKIRPGQYVAIVGKTGCGKSTLMRLLLGFEKPRKGAVYYDGKDLNNLDLKSLRKYMGVVMQNGKIFQGDIYSNITISAPWLTMDDAWEAAEMAGIAEDIRQMPMGMNTIISEGGGGFSGGQKQRLMIARAVAPKPKILLFDEATSALDNITQKVVSEYLDKLKCTRIVIAHRLSTIVQCDRIVVLDNGHIAEDGTYDELIKKNGMFAELVERQRVN